MLYVYTGQDDISVGTACANRLRSEWEELVVCGSSFHPLLSYLPPVQHLIHYVIGIVYEHDRDSHSAPGSHTTLFRVPVVARTDNLACSLIARDAFPRSSGRSETSQRPLHSPTLPSGPHLAFRTQLFWSSTPTTGVGHSH